MGRFYWIITRKLLLSGGWLTFGGENKIDGGVYWTGDFSRSGGISKFAAGGGTPPIPLSKENLGKSIIIVVWKDL